jgi:hypothetical protein
MKNIISDILLPFIAIFTAIGIWMISSAIEAKAYTRLTGKSVSVIDAMFLDLRVSDNVK